MNASLGRLRSIPRLLYVGAILLSLAGCSRPPRDSAEAVRHTILRAQLTGMNELATTLRDSLMTAQNRALISMDEGLLQQLVSAAVPFQRTIAGNVVVNVDTAWVQCQDGLALVRLAARASLGGNPESSAEMTIYAALRQVDFDPEEGMLSGRIEVIASETQRVRFMGLDKSMKDLIKDLARLRIDALAPLNYTVEIPLRLAGSVKLPEIGADGGEVRIPAARIPLQVAILPVMAFQGKLWIPVELGVPSEGVPPFNVAPAPRPTRPKFKSWRRFLPWRPRDIVAKRHTERRAEVEGLLKGDPYLSGALADSAALGIALPITLLNDLVAAIARRYLDQVEVNIPPGAVTVHEAGEIKVKTFLGRMTAATWTVDLNQLQLNGTLSAGVPEVMPAAGTDRIHLVMPVTLRDGRGTGQLAFHFDPRGLANLACDEFDKTVEIGGTLLSETYKVRGDFVLATEGDHLTAVPDFPPDRFTLTVEPTAATWKRVRDELEQQDKGKCGLFFDSEDGVTKLKRLCQQGFKVKLPRGIFRSVALPASFNRSVNVAGRPIQLSVLPRTLRVTAATCWYTASVDARTADGLSIPVPASPVDSSVVTQ